MNFQEICCLTRLRTKKRDETLLIYNSWPSISSALSIKSARSSASFCVCTWRTSPQVTVRPAGEPSSVRMSNESALICHLSSSAPARPVLLLRHWHAGRAIATRGPPSCWPDKSCCGPELTRRCHAFLKPLPNFHSNTWSIVDDSRATPKKIEWNVRLLVKLLLEV